MIIAIFILLAIAVTVFGAFSNLSSNINKVYNNLIQNYNLHNLVVNENYSQDPNVAKEQKASFEKELTALGVDYRDFNSINVNNTSNDELVKIIEYLASYSIDRLNIFEQIGLPISEEFKTPVLPNSIDLNQTIELASQNLTNETKLPENTFARQKLVFFLSKSNFKSAKFQSDFDTTWTYIQNNPEYDPLFVPSNTTNELTSVSEYLLSFLDPSNSKYNPLITRGNKIIANLVEFNSGIPATGYFEDPYSLIAIVSNAYLEANNKEIYSFSDFKQNIVQTNSNVNNDSPNLLPNNPSDFPNLKSTLEISELINNIDSKYKIFINNIPYLIVGSGITPDFTYPILSFENTIPNPKKEALIYANKNGFARAETSFESSPHESFLLAKYNGPLSKNEILEKVNVLAHQYMAWPSNITPAYWYDDINNKLTPTALRIEFINSVIQTFIGVVIWLTSFVLGLVIFAMVLFVKRFIGQNRVNLGIAMSNGISKKKILWSLSFVTTFICLIACPIGLLAANYFQNVIFQFLSNYWFLPTVITSFNIGWYFFITIIPMAFFILLIFGIGYLFLKAPLLELLKQNTTLKISKAYLGYSKLITKTSVMYKFRSSLVFSSFAKIFFIVMLSTLAMGSITFATSAANKIGEAYQLETHTNKSSYAIDLYTPTKQGGQYFGVPIQSTGSELISQNGNNLVDTGTNKGLYGTTYTSSPIFRNYSSLFWSGANDSSLQKNDITYIKNKTGSQILLNYFFGIGSLGTNPWNISKAFLPSNQMYTSNDLTMKLSHLILSDLRPYNQAYFDNLNAINPLTPTTNNSQPFPSVWVIQNFNLLNEPQNWKLNYNNNSEVGVINASEIFDFTSEEVKLKWTSPNDVLVDKDNLASIINNAYKTYGQEITETKINGDLKTRLQAKLYGDLFTQEAISDVEINGDIVTFRVDVNKNVATSLITSRSMFLNRFLTKTEIIDNDLTEVTNVEMILDPMDSQSFVKHQYGYKIANAIGLFKINDDYIKFLLRAYNDPAYLNYFYRILNNIVVLDNDIDEAYTYIKGRIDTFNDDIKVIGIQENSQYISLFNKNNENINNKLFARLLDEIPLIINEFAAKKYGFKVNDLVMITPSNSYDRLSYANSNDAIEALKTDAPNITNKEASSYTFRIVDINNTANDVQMYTSMSGAQKVLGLATSEDYSNNTNITTLENNELNVGMNNEWNSIGGFNGVFTKSDAPIMLSNTVSTYSSNGLYSGFDSWITSNEIISLIKSTFTNNEKLPYLANALQLTTSQLNDIKNEQLSNNVTLDDFAKRIINVLNYKYGSMGFNTIYENAIALKQQQVMFEQLSDTFNEIMFAITSLLILLSVIIVAIIAIMVISDLMKYTAILTTLGYSIFKNALILFSIFLPSWFFSALLTIPLTMFLNNFLQVFTFTNLSLLIATPFNWFAFGFVSISFLLLFGIIFISGMYLLKKTNILDALKW